MIKKMVIVMMLLLFFLPIMVSAESNNSCIVNSISGDNDNFGGNPHDMIHDEEDGAFDIWDTSDKTWNHTYRSFPSGSILSAKLSIVAYDIAYYDVKMDLGLYIEGKEVPFAFDGTPNSFPFNTFVFELDSSFFSFLEDGSVQIVVKNQGLRIDDFAIDYATLEIQGDCETTVNIDIKPGSDPSSFGANSKGKIPVALLGSASFDVTQVNDNTVRFGDSVDSGAVSSKNVGLEDKNGDGFMDKVYHFYFPETNLESSNIVAYLSGKLYNGESFVGSSDINIVGGNRTLHVASDQEVMEVVNNDKKNKIKTKKEKK